MTKIAFSEDEQRFIDEQVEAGNFEDAGEVVSAGLRMLEEAGRAREAWLSEEIPRRYEELQAGSSIGVSLDEAFARLEQRHRAAPDRRS